MPFTPFHFGPHACVGLPARKYLDLPVFLLANVMVDLEPLTVMVFDLDYPIHGYCHTFLIGAGVGLVWAILAYNLRNIFKLIMKTFRLTYETNFIKMAISGVLGVWLHVLFDAPLYHDIKPFFPWPENPLMGILSHSTVYRFCAFCFIPALIFYAIAFARYNPINHD